MAKTREQKQDNGLKIQDLLRTEGWQLLEQQIKQEIEEERVALQDLEPKSFPDLAMEFIGHQKMVRGLERIFEIIKEFLKDKDDADKGEKPE